MIEYTVKVDYIGTRRWYLNGKLHREDGPAVEYASGDKFWYLNGKCHREDGPASEYTDGDKAWYLSGVKYTTEGYYNKLKPAKELTMEELVKELGYNVKIVE